MKSTAYTQTEIIEKLAADLSLRALSFKDTIEGIERDAKNGMGYGPAYQAQKTQKEKEDFLRQQALSVALHSSLAVFDGSTLNFPGVRIVESNALSDWMMTMSINEQIELVKDYKEPLDKMKLSDHFVDYKYFDDPNEAPSASAHKPSLSALKKEQDARLTEAQAWESKSLHGHKTPKDEQYWSRGQLLPALLKVLETAHKRVVAKGGVPSVGYQKVKELGAEGLSKLLHSPWIKENIEEPLKVPQGKEGGTFTAVDLIKFQEQDMNRAFFERMTHILVLAEETWKTPEEVVCGAVLLLAASMDGLGPHPAVWICPVCQVEDKEYHIKHNEKYFDPGFGVHLVEGLDGGGSMASGIRYWGEGSTAYGRIKAQKEAFDLKHSLSADTVKTTVSRVVVKPRGI